jgi:CubicO group peptidase (beta-lactamase class C family)
VKAAVDDLTARARQEIHEGLLPSCQFALAIDGEVAETVTLGDTPAGDGTRYVLFSASKAPVSAAVWQLISEGKLALDDKVADHIPEFGTHGKETVTIEQLLSHTGGFPRSLLMPPDTDTRNSRLAAFSRWPLDWEPGSAFEYHITSANWVQVELLERYDGVDFRESFRCRISERLGLDSLRLGVPESEQGDIALACLVGEEPTPDELEAAIGIREIDRKEATDENLLLFSKPWVIEAGVPGGGAVATAADFALFWQALVHNPGKAWDPAVLADATGKIRSTDIDWLRGGVPANRSLGMIVAGDDGKAFARGFGYRVGPRAFGHDGAGGQTAWIDPDTGLSFVYLTNGIDRHLLRQWRRIRSIASKAALCAPRAATGVGDTSRKEST